MSKWLRENEEIPTNVHRFCIFALPQEKSLDWIAQNLTYAGVAVSFPTELDTVKIEPPAKAYFAFIEPQYIGITPDTIKNKLGALVVLISREKASAAVEIIYDYTDWFMQDEAKKPFVTAAPDDTLSAGLWFAAFGIWDPMAPSTDLLNERFQKAGMKLVVPEDAPKYTDPRYKAFIFHTGEQVRSPQSVQQVIEASQIAVNKHPVDIEEGILDHLAEGGVSDNLEALSKSAKEAAKAAVDAMTGLAEAQTVVFKVLKYGVWLGLGGLALYGGYRGYKLLKGTSK